MKLSEIYQTPDDTWDLDNEADFIEQSARSAKLVAKQRQDPRHTYLGSGTFAYVGTNDDDNFGDVHRIASADDGGSIYLKYIVDHPTIMDNPFFPKVREIADRSPQSKRNYQVTIIERLVPFNTKSIVHNSLLMTAIWNRYFHISQSVAGRRFYGHGGIQ